MVFDNFANFCIYLQYTMLSGRAPFQARSREDSAAAIMARIKGGQFDFNGPEWQHVSPQAKNVTKGEKFCQLFQLSL